jgi:hypothetical protein
MAQFSRRRILEMGPAVICTGFASPPADAIVVPLLRWLFAPLLRRSAQRAVGSAMAGAVRAGGATAAGGGMSAMKVIGGASAAIWAYLGVREIANIHPQAWERVKAMLPASLVDRQAGTPINVQLEMSGHRPSDSEPLYVHGGVSAVRPEALIGQQPWTDQNSFGIGVHLEAKPGQQVRIPLAVSPLDLGPGEWLLSSSLYDVRRQEYFESETNSHQLRLIQVR